jgi:hypothetical protein
MKYGLGITVDSPIFKFFYTISPLTLQIEHATALTPVLIWLLSHFYKPYRLWHIFYLVSVVFLYICYTLALYLFVCCCFLFVCLFVY